MRYLAFLFVALGLLGACGEREVILAGERLDLEGLETPEIVNRAEPISLPTQVSNPNWTHISGNNTHRIPHPALGRNLSQIWSANIGAGNSRKHRLTADPVVANGRIYTLDSQSGVVALTTGGAAIWTRNLAPASDDADESSGGGLAVGGGSLFVTTGFGQLTALNVTTGATQWVQDLESAATGAPTFSDGVVYVVTRNSIGWAIDATDGRILWQVLGLSLIHI